MMNLQTMGSVNVWDLKLYYDLGFNGDELPENASKLQRWTFYFGRREREAEDEYQAALNR